jgi:hypothetical protein
VFVRDAQQPSASVLVDLGSGRVLDMTLPDTEAYVNGEITRWTKVIRDAGIKLP